MLHLSCLKRALGHVRPSTKLQPLYDEGKLILVLEIVLVIRENRLRSRMNRTITNHLV